MTKQSGSQRQAAYRARQKKRMAEILEIANRALARDGTTNRFDWLRIKELAERS